MPLALYGHPFSSYTQKALMALYENDTPFEFRCVSPETPEHVAEWTRLWPLRKFPVLLDDEHSIAEASIIIEYLQRMHGGKVRFLPEDPVAALDVRFLDRFFDLHVMSHIQHAVNGALSGEEVIRERNRAESAERLERAYAWLEQHLADGRAWAAGESFTLADCAAAPALFYGDWTHRIAGTYAKVHAYRARLLSRPSFARAVDEARPYRPLFPLGAPDRD